MAARFDDAQAGWEIFRQAGFSLTRDELNVRLEEGGYMPISVRTFAHYEKLRRYGYERYVPINQLDVKSLKDPLWDKAVRGRYPVYGEPVEAVVKVAQPAGDTVLHGTTEELSPAYVSLRVEGPEDVAQLARTRFQRQIRSRRVQIAFPVTGDEFAAIVEKVAVEEDHAQLVLRFVSLAPVESLTGRTLLSTDVLHVRIEPSDAAPMFSETVRKLYWLFQVVDTCKVICEEFLFELGFGEKYAVPPVRVQALELRDSLEATLVAGQPALLLVTHLAERLAQLQVDEAAGRLAGGKRGYVQRSNELFTEVAFQIKRHMMNQLATREQQVKLPFDEPYGRSGELAESQLLPALDELLDVTSGKVTLTLAK